MGAHGRKPIHPYCSAYARRCDLSLARESRASARFACDPSERRSRGRAGQGNHQHLQVVASVEPINKGLRRSAPSPVRAESKAIYTRALRPAGASTTLPCMHACIDCTWSGDYCRYTSQGINAFIHVPPEGSQDGLKTRSTSCIGQ